jgi:hypothetical protein
MLEYTDFTQVILNGKIYFIRNKFVFFYEKIFAVVTCGRNQYVAKYIPDITISELITYSANNSAEFIVFDLGRQFYVYTPMNKVVTHLKLYIV